MTKNKILIFSIIGLFLFVSIFAVGFVVGGNKIKNSNYQAQEVVESRLAYADDVLCPYVIRASGVREDYDCSHNLVYDSGLNMTRDLMISGSGMIMNISVANATAGVDAPAAGGNAWTVYDNCGLASRNASYSINPGAGNWSSWVTFTASCDGLAINGTVITNTTGAKFAAGLLIYTIINTNDAYTINYTRKVSNA